MIHEELIWFLIKCNFNSSNFNSLMSAGGLQMAAAIAPLDAVVSSGVGVMVIFITVSPNPCVIHLQLSTLWGGHGQLHHGQRQPLSDSPATLNGVLGRGGRGQLYHGQPRPLFYLRILKYDR